MEMKKEMSKNHRRMLVDDEEGEDAVATEMRGPEEPTNAMRKHHQLTHIQFQAWCEQCVRGSAPDPPHRRLGGGVREEIVIQTDCCFMKARPQDDLITALVGVDDSFGRCVAICVERKGARDVLGRDSTRSLCEVTGSATSDNTERWRTHNS